MTSRLIAVALASAGLAGCVKSVPIAPATLTFARTDCAAAPDIATAVSLMPEKDKKVWVVDRQMSASGPCLTQGGVSAPYMVFALPEAGRARVVELGAALDSGRVVSPRVVLLDETGAETRSFTRDQYMFRPGILSIQFVPQARERYALLTVDPEPIGQSHDTIVLGTSNTYVYTGYGATNWRSGQESMLSRGFSYEGPVRALVYRPDDKD